MAKLFISHSSKDNFEALALAQWLTAEGFDDLFLDLDPERGIAAGERWERKLTEEADRCEAVLFLVGKSWLASPWCLRELNLAQRLSKQIFVALIEDLAISKLPKDLTRTFQTVNLAAGDDHRPHRAKHPTTGKEAHVTFSEGGLKRLKAGLKKAGLDPSHFDWPPKDDPNRAPWQGLRALGTGDAGIFLGRDAPIIDALDQLRGLSDGRAEKLFVILGASGAGKSSFLRAGLWPRLTRDDERYVTLPIIRPAAGVLSAEEGLVAAIASLQKGKATHNRAEIRKAIEACTVPPLLAEAAKDRTLVFPIDQAEELFQAAGREESEVFLKFVAMLVRSETPRALFLFTIRSDSYEPLQTAKSLEGLKPALFPLQPLAQGTLSTVIEGPAHRMTRAGRKLVIEPALTQHLLADLAAGGGKDTLPLLSFTLERLYADYGADGDLKLSEYKDFGGLSGAIDTAVKGALAKAANDPRVPQDLETQKALLRGAFIPWLASIDPETQSPRRMVARKGDIPPEYQPIISYLVDARLLTTDKNAETGEETIEPAHEALLRQWGMLAGWLQDDFANLATLETVKRAARDWHQNLRSDAWLNHRDTRLVDAEALFQRSDLAAKLDSIDREYLTAARANETAEQQRKDQAARKLKWAAIAACILALIAGLTAWWGNEKRLEAVGKEKEAVRQQIELASSAADSKLAVGDVDGALQTLQSAAKLFDANTMPPSFYPTAFVSLTESDRRKTFSIPARKEQFFAGDLLISIDPEDRTLYAEFPSATPRRQPQWIDHVEANETLVGAEAWKDGVVVTLARRSTMRVLYLSGQGQLLKTTQVSIDAGPMNATDIPPEIWLLKDAMIIVSTHAESESRYRHFAHFIHPDLGTSASKELIGFNSVDVWTKPSGAPVVYSWADGLAFEVSSMGTSVFFKDLGSSSDTEHAHFLEACTPPKAEFVEAEDYEKVIATIERLWTETQNNDPSRNWDCFAIGTSRALSVDVWSSGGQRRQDQVIDHSGDVTSLAAFLSSETYGVRPPAALQPHKLVVSDDESLVAAQYDTSVFTRYDPGRDDGTLLYREFKLPFVADDIQISGNDQIWAWSNSLGRAVRLSPAIEFGDWYAGKLPEVPETETIAYTYMHNGSCGHDYLARGTASGKLKTERGELRYTETIVSTDTAEERSVTLERASQRQTVKLLGECFSISDDGNLMVENVDGTVDLLSIASLLNGESRNDAKIVGESSYMKGLSDGPIYFVGTEMFTILEAAAVKVAENDNVFDGSPFVSSPFLQSNKSLREVQPSKNGKWVLVQEWLDESYIRPTIRDMRSGRELFVAGSAYKFLNFTFLADGKILGPGALFNLPENAEILARLKKAADQTCLVDQEQPFCKAP